MKTQFVTVHSALGQEEQLNIACAAQIIRDGGLVIFPTETVYGLGGDATNPAAANAIYAAKGRPADNPLIIHIATPADAEKYTYTSPVYHKLAEAFMPGPLTVIMKSKPCIPLSVRAGLDTVAVRCPSHPVANALIRAAGVPIAAPSANLSGKPSPTCFEHVKYDMDGRVDMIIDGGDAEVGLESTIVKIEDDGTLLLLRPGKITTKELNKIVPGVRVASAVTAQLKQGETVLSPGMKYRHYAPSAPLYLIKGSIKARQKFFASLKGKNGLLSYTDEVEMFASIFGEENVFPLGLHFDLDTQAHNLFHLLWEVDKRGYDAIYAPLPPQDGLGLALYNRMIRAAAYQIIDLDQEKER